VSTPLVEYVKFPDVKGSSRSGDRGLSDNLEAGESVIPRGSSDEKGWEESNRIAWVIVGWKRPPWVE
jgi:hypothetical protein